MQTFLLNCFYRAIFNAALQSSYLERHLPEGINIAIAL